MRLRKQFSALLTTMPRMTIVPGIERVPNGRWGRTQGMTDAPAFRATDQVSHGSAAVIGIVKSPAA
jgi:hypothetical protein